TAEKTSSGRSTKRTPSARSAAKSAVAAASDAVLAGKADGDRLFAYTLDALTRFRADVGGWTLIADGAYSEARAAALGLDS
ncbi:MAG: hypothetical protein AAFW69_09090, partial [Pseudomonadota bacterium]